MLKLTVFLVTCIFTALILKTEANDVTVSVQGNQVVLDNGIVNVTLANPQGMVIGVQYGGIDNLLDSTRGPFRRGYWDINWNEPGGPSKEDDILATEFKVVKSTPDLVEVSFVRKWDPSIQGKDQQAPIDVDIRYILQKGSSGFYVYAIYERNSEYPAFALGQTRMVFRLDQDRFNHISLSDKKQKLMAIELDRDRARSAPLEYPEAVILTDPTNPALKGQVDDKYQYSSDVMDDGVHGWFSLDPLVGFWVIFPSQEFRSGGPTKQELTVHTGPICLVMLHSAHYMGNNSMIFDNGESWKKVFGPIKVHLNVDPELKTPSTLWNDAKQKRLSEQTLWPYSFPNYVAYLKEDQRCSISGRLLVQDRFISPNAFPGKFAYLGLAAPGKEGSWQKESKGYQFWTNTNQDGNFRITNILPGEYNLYGWVQNIVGDYKHETPLKLSPGSSIDLGDLIYEPPRNGPTIWEIGIPDRTAKEFFIPDPAPKFINNLYLHNERLNPNGRYTTTTWQLKFKLENLINDGSYTLHIAIASATHAHLQVLFNDQSGRYHFEATLNEQDNAIARHGIHGFYQFFSVLVNPNWVELIKCTMIVGHDRGRGRPPLCRNGGRVGTSLDSQESEGFKIGLSSVD
ncbi:hypothetical protein SUGI_1022190 [Cryptomeria japonica]|nr:hypothetical protein SUGI_1022190 [Cryptomeria japonica]